MAGAERAPNLHRSCKRPVVTTKRGSQFNEPELHHVREGQSLQTVVDAASPGDEVVVHGGLYTEPLKVRTRNLWIHAAEDETPTIHVNHTRRLPAAVTFTLCNLCKFEGITVKNDFGVAILVSRCAPEIVSCCLTGTGGGISVTKNNEYPQTHPIISGCTVQKCKGPGIVLKDAKAIIEGNTILHNSDAAIAYSGLSNPWIKGNFIKEGKGAGIAVQDLATGVIRDNVIEANECAGIMVDSMAHPSVWRNVIRNGGAEGVHLETSRGVFEGNEFTGNAACDVFIGAGCDTLLMRNSFHNGAATALIIERANPVVQQNSFHSYEGSCITVTGNGASCIRENTITISLQPGIVVGEHCNGVVERNEFHLIPCSAPAATITSKKGSYVHVSDNVVKNMAPFVLPYDVLRTAHDYEDSETSDVDPSQGLTTSEGFHEEHTPTPKRRHSAFAERLLAMSAQNTKRQSTSPVAVTPPAIPAPAAVPSPATCPAGSGGAAVHLIHQHDEEKVRHTPPLTPVSISDISFPSMTPTESLQNDSHTAKVKPLATKGYAKARRLSDLSVQKVNSQKELRRNSTVVRPSGWNVEKEDKKNKETQRRASSKKKKEKSRKNVISEMSEIELRAELEAVRKLLTVDELRQELQLLRNWLGHARLSGKQVKKAFG